MKEEWKRNTAQVWGSDTSTVKKNNTIKSLTKNKPLPNMGILIQNMFV